jgi:hypothetical protein
MPNITETSVSDISLSRACTVMIIFFLADGKSIEGPDAAIQPASIRDPLHIRPNGLAALSPADVYV